MVGVLVGVLVAVLVGVSVGGTGVLVGVLVGVSVGGTGVLVGVLVDVFVGGTGVLVGVFVGVLVGVRVGQLGGSRRQSPNVSFSPPAPRYKTASIKSWLALAGSVLKARSKIWLTVIPAKLPYV